MTHAARSTPRALRGLDRLLQLALLLPLLLLLLAQRSAVCDAFSVVAGPRRAPGVRPIVTLRRMSDEAPAATAASESAFVPLADDEEGVSIEAIEALGKSKRGKRKDESAAPSEAKRARPPKSGLAAEEVYYEGPPAITETIAPTISILTVVGIIPAAAAWARQAWVRYKITSRRIRVTSGIGGKDMAEIVYPDIVEIRSAKRLFGDGDMVAFLRDGAKFEMRNIPRFDEAIEFILQQCDPEVIRKYREKGDVTNRPAN